MLSFPFASIADLDAMGVPADDQRRRLNKIVNPLSEASPYLRTSLLPGLFAAAVRNISRGNDDLALFEAGSVFFANDPLTACTAPAVTQRPSAEELARSTVHWGGSRDISEPCLRAAGSPTAGRDQATPAGWEQADRVRGGGCSRGRMCSLDRRAAEYAPWHPGRCAEFNVPAGSTEGSPHGGGSATPASCIRRSVRLLACRPAPRLPKSILTP